MAADPVAGLLRQLDYVYPYHQAIGFYLERSGCYDTATVKLFEKPKSKHDFYLAHQMEAPAYSEK